MFKRSIAVCLITSLLGCVSVPPESAYNLGVNAYRVENYQEARKQWTKAVEENQLLAFNNLGYLLYQGLGGPKDYSRAVALWKQVAMQGFAESQMHLGNAYSEGKGVEKSDIQAYAWLRCSLVAATLDPPANEGLAALNIQTAKRAISALQRELPATQLAIAEQLAKQYVAAYAKRPPV